MLLGAHIGRVPGERYSSDKSIITVLDEEMPPEPPSASQQAWDFIYGLSPTSATSWLKKLLKQAWSTSESDDNLNIIE